MDYKLVRTALSDIEATGCICLTGMFPKDITEMTLEDIYVGLNRAYFIYLGPSCQCRKHDNPLATRKISMYIYGIITHFRNRFTITTGSCETPDELTYHQQKIATLERENEDLKRQLEAVKKAISYEA